MATEEINAFVIEGILPTSWDPKTSKITYGLLDQLFKALDRYSLPQSKIVTLCANLASLEFESVYQIIMKPSNLKRTVSRASTKNESNSVTSLKRYDTIKFIPPRS